MFHIFQLWIFAFSLTNRKFCFITQNKFVADHILDKIHINQNSVVTLNRSVVVLEVGRIFFVADGRINFFDAQVDANVIPLINVNKFYIFVWNWYFKVALYFHGKIFWVRKKFLKDIVKSFDKLIGIFCERLKKIIYCKHFLYLQNKIFAVGEKNNCVDFIALTYKLH